ncbi:tripartite tricarboxylate transporter substrate binding protein [Halobacillus sp. B23F22_1]|uniref:tripartite tricarboxylate transporter substrate binding protein n=1 Tax=Halobacillus sp. B23F22_1 TaxID=3459514 RepID=UPI00373E5083
MNYFSKYFFVICLGTLLLLAGCSGEESSSGDSEDASSFPEKPVTLIVPSAAGGGTDSTARALADATEEHLGESIGVENKEGGSGATGMTEGANAAPDGYTVSMVFVELTMLKHLGVSNISSDQFKPLGLVNLDPAALTVPADAPYDTIEEFIEYAEEHPGEVQVGNAGAGSIWHIAAESFAKETGIELNHVPFEGAAPAVTSLMGGHIDAVTVSPAEVLPQVESGDLKTLGVMSEDRSDIMPDVPTFEEEGVDATPVGTWRGLVVPQDTPDEVADKLEEAFLKGAEEDEFTEFMDSNGLGLEIKDSEEFEQFMQTESDFYGDIISDLDLGNNE